MNLKSLFIFLIFSPILAFGQCEKYIKVIDAETRQPLDSMAVGIYKVSRTDFIYITSTTTDSNGIAIFRNYRDSVYKVNANDHHQQLKYWPEIGNIDHLLSDTFILRIHRFLIREARIQNVYFAFDQATLIDFYKGKVDSVISVLNQNPNFKIQLQAHTDDKGPGDYNIKLSQKRADAVKAYMVSREIDQNRILTKAKGGSFPLVPNEKDGIDDPEGRAQNRRVEFGIIPDAPKDAPAVEYEHDKIPSTKLHHFNNFRRHSLKIIPVATPAFKDSARPKAGIEIVLVTKG